MFASCGLWALTLATTSITSFAEEAPRATPTVGTTVGTGEPAPAATPATTTKAPEATPAPEAPVASPAVPAAGDTAPATQPIQERTDPPANYDTGQNHEVTAPEPLPDLTNVPTLVPMPKEPPDVQEVEIPAKPVAIISGDSTWDDSIVNLAEAFKKLDAALAKAGKKSAGRPVAVFTKSTEDGFSYDALIPLAEAPAADATALADNIRYGTSPIGKAIRFIHKDPYELISMTYEGIALYMENKNLVGKDELIEEYVTDITDQADKKTIVNIYIQLENTPQPAQKPAEQTN
ncbi:GyrI-like domain-containing protein [Microvirga sp. W0021]|uniref:GyrI-like domain-containing protein n=1 Tax=Hohaiivirga grylli TaxID=3133970 RepID=A0ABV0BGX3_9HYPH